MQSKMLEKLQIDTDKIVLYSPDSLKYITDEIIEKTLEKMPEIYNFFGITNFRKLQINLFDNLEKFRNFVIFLRNGAAESLPEYAHGTYDRGMVNSYVHPHIVKDSPLYISRLYHISHELVHILYWELILKDDFSQRVVWLDEGLAQYLSGQRDTLNNINNFKGFYQNIINNTKIYPNLNVISQGHSFVNENYNGYDLSYLCVKYLFDTKTIEEIRNIVFSYEASHKIGETILQETIEYYNNRLEITIKTK